MKRRDFIASTGGALMSTALLSTHAEGSHHTVKGEFKISVAAWSWHKMFFAGDIVQMDQVDLTKQAGATGLELVNSFFPSPQFGYLNRLKNKAADEGIEILLVMVDDEGDMSSPDFRTRHQAVINHRKWVDIAATLGCHSIRANSGSKNVSPEEDMKVCAESFYELSEYARQYNMNVLIENHWQNTEDPKWLADLMKMVDVDNFGTLPDFGNFPGEVDKYEAIDMLMPWAKAVSAKCHEFGPDGNEVNIDYAKMMEIVFKHGYNGYVGVEYEGSAHSEVDGVAACVKLLKTFQA